MNKEDANDHGDKKSSCCLQRNYEMLGAPVLLFRNDDSYTSFQTQSQPVSVQQIEDMQKRKRVQSQWYCPIETKLGNLVKRDIPGEAVPEAMSAYRESILEKKMRDHEKDLENKRK